MVRRGVRAGRDRPQAGADRRRAIRRRTTSARARYPRPAHRHAGRDLRQGISRVGSHCFAYIHATEVGGTHPALIEAMGRGALVLYLEHAGEREVAGDAGIPFEPGMIWRSRSRGCWGCRSRSAQSLRCRALARVRERYSWEAVTDAYERLFGAVVRLMRATWWITPPGSGR